MDAPPDCPGLDDCAEAGPLKQQIKQLRESVNIVAAGHVLLADQMAEITVRLDRHERRLADLSTVPGELAANTAATRDVLAAVVETRDMVQFARDAQAAGRLGKRLARAGSKVALGAAALITALAGAWWSIKGGGPPPKP